MSIVRLLNNVNILFIMIPLLYLLVVCKLSILVVTSLLILEIKEYF